MFFYSAYYALYTKHSIAKIPAQGMKFAVMGLGSRDYVNFNQSGKARARPSSSPRGDAVDMLAL